jgi:hypothetical protein
MTAACSVNARRLFCGICAVPNFSLGGIVVALPKAARVADEPADRAHRVDGSGWWYPVHIYTAAAHSS